MEQYAVAEGLEVAMPSTLDPHGLNAGVEAFGGGIGDPQSEDAHDALQVVFDGLRQPPHGIQRGGPRHRDPLLEMVSRILLARALAVQAKYFLQPVRLGGVGEPFSDVGDLLLGPVLLAGSGRQQAVASLLEDCRTLGIVQSLMDGDLLAADLFHRFVGQLHDVERIEDNSCLIEDFLGSLLEGAVQIHRQRGHTSQDRLAKPIQCGLRAGGGVVLDQFLDNSTLGVAHHRGALAKVPVLLVDREMLRHVASAVGPSLGLANETSFDCSTRDARKAVLGAAKDLRRPATGAAQHQINRQGFKQQSEARARFRPRNRQLLNAVLRTGHARNRANQKRLYLAGVQVPPASLRGVIMDAAGRPATGARQGILRPVGHMNPDLPDRGVQVNRGHLPRRGQTKNVGVQRRAIQWKLSSQTASIKGASATKLPVDPKIAQ